MTDPKGMKELEPIFHEAVLRQGADRQQYLDAACGANRDLRREIESLLESDAQTTVGLNHPVVDLIRGPRLSIPVPQPRRRPDRRSRAMQQIQCSRGHFYNPDQHHSCPYCGISGLSGGRLEPPAYDASLPSRDYLQHVFDEEPTRRKVTPDDAPTQMYDPSRERGKVQINPVVGWLVCVHGPDRGQDYRIRAQRNFIGRDAGMDICISGDPAISRKNHAILIYDPRTSSFRIAPGDAHGMTYLNNEAVDVPMTLKPYDAIELGAAGSTKLLFVPFCGEEFQW